jgi:hypothetical protein
MSTLPSVSFQTSSAVVLRWIAGLAGFLNCCGRKESGVEAASSSALATAPFIPFGPSVRTSSAPKALRIFRLSMLIVSGMVSMSLYPFAAATKAKAIPVFPDVGSMITESFLSNPLCSESSIMASQIRSFTLDKGLKNSNFAAIFAFPPAFSRLISTKGVFPINLVMSFAIDIDYLLFLMFSK